MTGLTRKPSFWIAYAGLALISVAIAWKLVPLALPLVNLDITLSRQDAIAKAEALSTRYRLAPDGARAAARFNHDQSTQNYVELEGGGKPAFAELVAGTIYAPYWWEVRLFAAGEVTESIVRFRPDGAVYGFAKRLPELFVPADAARLALDAPSARRLAEDRARDGWAVDFAPFKLLEQTQQKRTTGRVDHGFVYERMAQTIGDARFRLRIGVSGDELTEVTYYVHIPESFDRRFEELRSANNTIAGIASLSAGVLYGLGGCLLGALWLLRARWLQWRPALAAGLIVGALMGAMTLANTPAAWFGFDTAQSVTTFWLRQAGVALVVTLGGGLGYALVFMAAESLSRRAFPQHPQLWRAWSRDAAPTRQILGRTLGGYLFVPVELAMIAVFYYATNRWLGWWQPSESLTDPNILGSFVPALAPIAISLQAGFMEESLFRAVPLALAAIVGARFGKRGLAIGIAVVVQALIFGGAHANYPGFPSYSRPVELILPSVLWALIFLRFGLLPTVLLHALFDLTLFAIPVFLVDAPGSALQRALIIAAALVPLAVVLVRRWRAGAWGELPAALRNGAWRPATSAAETTEATAPAPVTAATQATAAAEQRVVARWIPAFQRSLPVLGVAGLVAWVVATPFSTDAPGLPIDRAQAVALADAALEARGVVLGVPWKRFSAIRLVSDEPSQWLGHKFVWREAGPAAYAKLVGTTLAPPLWEVRYASFEGEVADRAEEWRVTVNGDGSVRQVRHALPEARAGATLSRDAGLALVERALSERFGADPGVLKLIGAEEGRRPARTDWSFMFADPRIDVGKDGEARAVVDVAGDEIVGAGRFVHVPEAWQRIEREREGRQGIIGMALGVSIALAGLAALIVAIIQWTRGHCDRRALAAVAAIGFAISAAALANGWPQMAMGLHTAEPIASQVALAALGALLGGVVVALLFGLMAGVGAWAAVAQRPRAIAGRLPVWAAGAAAGLFAAGLGAIFERLAPAGVPRWPAFPVEATALPWFGALLQGAGALTAVTLALFLLFWIERLTGGWQRRGWLAVAVLTAVTVATMLIGTQDPVVAAFEGVVTGLAAAAIVYGLLRFDYLALPAYMATGYLLTFGESAAQRATPGAWVHAALAGAVTIAIAWGVTRYLSVARSRAAAAS